MTSPRNIPGNSNQAAAAISEPSSLNEQNILVAVTGGIACYKTADLVSKLVQRGADVRVMMTRAATKFVAPLTFQSLSGHPVHTSTWEADEFHQSPHIGLARWAHRLVIAPATANTIAKIAHGLCDDLVSLVACALPSDTPVLMAPSMNDQMWQNAITQKNIHTLADTLDYQLVGPGDGWQACRTLGTGRMAEAVEILEAVEASFA